MLLQKPVGKALEPGFDIHLGMIAEHRFGFAQVGIGDGNVTRLHGLPIERCLIAE